MDNYEVIDFVQKPTSHGKPFLRATLKDAKGNLHTGVAIWSSFPAFTSIGEGSKLFGVIVDNGKGKTLNPTSTASGSVQKPPQTPFAHAQEVKGAQIKNAQDTKETGIKLAGAMRDATLIVTTLYADIIKNIPEDQRAEKIREALAEWREFLITEFEMQKSILEGNTAF